jgi:hypothetical protein
VKRFLLLLSLCILVNDCGHAFNTQVKRAESVSQDRGLPMRQDARFLMLDEDRALIEQLLKEAEAYTGIGERMRVISERLLGSKYIVKPLKGSLDSPEQFVTRTDGFDCVTYVETVLALGKSKSADEFAGHLREIRYKDGEVDYIKRLHYISEWNEVKILSGVLQDVTQGKGTIECTKPLSWLKGIRPKVAQFRYFPKSQLKQVSSWLQDGDLIYFVTSRSGLDFYHMGVIFLNGDQVVMRHAARSQGVAVEQDLASFCNKNAMQGFVIMRPTP